jgi:hypothetical protein
MDHMQNNIIKLNNKVQKKITLNNSNKKMKMNNPNIRKKLAEILSKGS